MSINEPKDYWESRWKDSFGKSQIYAGSWPDGQARWLELRFIADQLKKLQPKTLLEIGCGPFTLSEDVEITDICLHQLKYFGVDSSESAIAKAKAAYRGLHFRASDIAIEKLYTTVDGRDFECVLSRRTLQNLSVEQRKPVLPQVLAYPHGILIECTKMGLYALNTLRIAHHLSPLSAPQFNSYLDPDEVELILKTARPAHFADLYYLLTRGTQDLTEFNTQFHFRAASLCRDYPLQDIFGPLQGFVW